MTTPLPALQQAAYTQIQGALRTELERLEQTVKQCRTVADIEPSLHRLRVRTRRLRSVLKMARPFLPENGRRLQRGYAKLARASNPERDGQVFAQQLQRWSEEHPPLRATCQLLLEELQARSGRLDGLALSMDYLKRYQRLNHKLAKKLALMTPPDQDREQSLGQYLTIQLVSHRELWRKQWQSWLDGDDAALHELRLEVKRLRYVLLPWAKQQPHWQAWLERMALLQNKLGQAQDYQVQVQLLQQLIPAAAQSYFTQLTQLQALSDAHTKLSTSLNEAISNTNVTALAGCHVLLPFLRQQEAAHLQQLKQQLNQAQLDAAMADFDSILNDLQQSA